jgi:fluoride exporter
MLKTVIAIGLGGAFGSIARHFMNSGLSAIVRTPFPWGILAINVLGCFAMGVLVAVFAGAGNPSQDMRAFLTAGFLGGFTTFSAFSLDAMNLWVSGDVKGFAIYVSASVILSIAAIFAGSFIAWKFIA